MLQFENSTILGGTVEGCSVEVSSDINCQTSVGVPRPFRP